MLRLRRGYLCTKREFNIYRDWAWSCEAASSLALQVSWLIFEPGVSKIALKASWKQEAFISQRRPIPGVSVITLEYVLDVMYGSVFYVLSCGRGALCAVCLLGGYFGLVVRLSVVSLISYERFV